MSMEGLPARFDAYRAIMAKVSEYGSLRAKHWTDPLNIEWGEAAAQCHVELCELVMAELTRVAEASVAEAAQ